MHAIYLKGNSLTSEAGRKLYSLCEYKHQYYFLIQEFFPGSKGILSLL